MLAPAAFTSPTATAFAGSSGVALALTAPIHASALQAFTGSPAAATAVSRAMDAPAILGRFKLFASAALSSATSSGRILGHRREAKGERAGREDQHHPIPHGVTSFRFVSLLPGSLVRRVRRTWCPVHRDTRIGTHETLSRVVAESASAAASAAIAGTHRLPAAWAATITCSHGLAAPWAATIAWAHGLAASGTRAITRPSSLPAAGAIAGTVPRSVALSIAKTLALACSISRPRSRRVALRLRHSRKTEEQRERHRNYKHLVHHCLTLRTMGYASFRSTIELASGFITARTLERAYAVPTQTKGKSRGISGGLCKTRTGGCASVQSLQGSARRFCNHHVHWHLRAPFRGGNHFPPGKQDLAWPMRIY